MTHRYIQDPNDPTQVIDTTVLPPSIDPTEIEQQIKDLRDTILRSQQTIESCNVQIPLLQSQLDAIYAQVPEVKPLEDNASQDAQ